MSWDEQDEWCREESCRHRHWRSGSTPTHKRGADCPVMTSTAHRPCHADVLLEIANERPQGADA